MEKRLFLLDAFALIFRAYYALIRNPRVTSKGKNTNVPFSVMVKQRSSAKVTFLNSG
jgi:5'-3' exonuclease